MDDTTSWMECAKIVWRWHALAPQIVRDYRYHRQFSGLQPPLLNRVMEQLMLLWRNRVNAADYYNMGLFDPAMPTELKFGYMGRYESWRLFLAFNPIEQQRLTSKKLEFNAYATAAGLPTAEVLAVVSQRPSGCGVPHLGTEEELATWMEDNAVADVVFKPVDGTKGWGVISVGERVAAGKWKKLPMGETIDLAALWVHCARYLYRGGAVIQRRLVPHPTLAKLMPDVLHTVRAITYLDPEPVLIDAVLRVGDGKGGADNMTQGGIVVPLDLHTGRCGQGTKLVNGLPRHLDEHPVTGARITGVDLPDWNDVCELAKAAARRFSMLKSVGWDIGITTKGAALLEGNSTYDLTLNQIGRRTGILTTSWADAFHREAPCGHIGLGFPPARPRKI